MECIFNALTALEMQFIALKALGRMEFQRISQPLKGLEGTGNALRC